MSEAEAQRSVDDGGIATEISSEEQRVLEWRYTEIRRLGIDRVQAHLLAEGDADLNQLRQLVDSGCPPQVAARIIL